MQSHRVNKYKPRNVNRGPARSPRVPVMTTTENVTRWIVDQEFRETQDQIGMPLGNFVSFLKSSCYLILYKSNIHMKIVFFLTFICMS